MRKVILCVFALAAAFGLYAAVEAAAIAPAHADYFQYPCNYPFTGAQVDIKIIVDAGGQYCDGPSEVNWTHYHCSSGGATVSGSGIGLAPIGSGFSIGGIGGGPIGGSGGVCEYQCPDGTRGPFPNPPAVWVKHLVLEPKNNDCVGHMVIRGDSSTPLPNALPGNIAPGDDPPPGVAVPVAPGALPEGVTNPDAKPGIPPPTPQVPNAAVPMPAGKPITPSSNEVSPLTPGSPMAMP